MGNYNDDLFNFVLECLKRYCELDPLCSTIIRIDELVQEFKDYLEENGITVDSNADEIFAVFLSTFLDKINPVRPKKRQISALICEYCLKWSEMTIGTGQDAKVVRPPYVLNSLIKDKRDLEGWNNSGKSNLRKSVKPESERKEFDYQDYGGSEIGKAHPDTIVNFLTQHCSTLSASAMQEKLEKFCIGADCTGFVTRTLAYVMERMKWNSQIQYKTIGPNDDDYTTEEEKTGRKHLKLGKKSRLNTAASFFKFYMEDSSEKQYDHIYIRDSKTVTNQTKPIENHLGDDIIVGSRLIYRFKKIDDKAKKVDWDLINKDFNPEDEPRITNLRPGDIITMDKDDSFWSSFHIAIICNVGVDQIGPYFITADSSIFTLAGSDAKAPSNFILQRPDALDTVNLSAPQKLPPHQKGNGVRYVLHRGFDFFSRYKNVYDFRRPYAFDLYYRNVNMEEK